MKLVLFVTILLLSCNLVSATALGVNKAVVRFENVLSNGYAEDSVMVSTDAVDDIPIEYEFIGEIAEWMTIHPTNASELVFNGEVPLRINIIAQPPADIANGTYNGKLRLLTGSFARSGGQFGSSIRASFTLKIYVDITNQEVQSCIAGGFEIRDTEIQDPFDFYATVRNSGNVRVTPEFEIDVWDQYQTRIVMSTEVLTNEQIFPTTQENFLRSIEHELGIGQYWARVKENVCLSEDFITFSVVDLGGVSDQGVLLRIDNQPWAETDDIIRIAAIFKNTGSRVVNAKFRGTIEKDEKIVEVIDTDFFRIAPQETSELDTFFNPKEPGRYIVRGRVIYNEKLSFEKSSILTVKGEITSRVTGNVAMDFVKNPYQAAFVLILLAIVFMAFLIHKEKRKRRGFIRY